MAAPQAEPTTSDGGDGANGGSGDHRGGEGRKKRDHWSLLEKLLGFLTALLTLATAGLAFLAASASSERDEAQDQAAQLSDDLQARTGDLDAAQAQIADLEQQLADATSTTTTTTPDDPDEPPPGATSLPELDPVVDDNWDFKRDLDVDGTLHPQGIQTKALGYCGSAVYIEQQVEYSIGRQYSRLEALAGLSEDSLPSLPVRLEIFGDGRSLWSETLVVGAPKPVDLDVSGVLRLRIVASKDFDDPGGSGCKFVYAALGAPTLHP